MLSTLVFNSMVVILLIEVKWLCTEGDEFWTTNATTVLGN